MRVAVLLLALSVLPAAAGAEECLTVDNFAKGKVGEFPRDWKPRKDAGREVYSIQDQDGARFLRALARGLGIQAARQYEWEPKVYPTLAWSWRPMEFPHGSDERQPKTNDSAVAVYAVFPHTPWSVKTLKYIWSAVVPAGTRLSSSAGLTQVLVLRNGTDRKGGWIEERVNVYEDYKKFFDETDAPKASGIAVLTDSDDTKTVAQGDYSNFRVCRP